jgi:type IV secretory pathway protease TraF
MKRTTKQSFVVAGAVVLALGAGGITLLLMRELVWQNGDSMPKGLYVYAHAPPVEKGEVVILRDPPRFKLPWLMKRVEGVAGDTYCWDAQAGSQRLNGRLMPGPHPKAAELGIDVWRGCRALLPGEIVGYGQSDTSFDSRYFGPVLETRLTGAYRRLL